MEVSEARRGAEIVPYKLVLKDNRNSDGTFEPRKARLVLLRKFKKPDIDLNHTYAPVADFARSNSDCDCLWEAVDHLLLGCEVRLLE
jgi:hypothetical protein